MLAPKAQLRRRGDDARLSHDHLDVLQPFGRRDEFSRRYGLPLKLDGAVVYESTRWSSAHYVRSVLLMCCMNECAYGRSAREGMRNT